MAGRGRGSVLPAWMTEGAAEVPGTASVSSSNLNGQFDNAPSSAPILGYGALAPTHGYQPPLPVTAQATSIPGYGVAASTHGYQPPLPVSAPAAYGIPSEASYSNDGNRGSRRERSRSREKEGTFSPPREGTVTKKSKKNWRGSRPAPTKSNWDIGPNGQFTPQNMHAHLMASHSATPAAPLNRGVADALNDSKHARKLYVGGLPPGTTEDEISAFFNDVFAKCAPPQYMQQGNPILSVSMHNEKCFAFVEFNTIELTSACLMLDGAPFPHKSGQCVVRMRRPKDYRPELVPEISRTFPSLDLSGLGVVATSVEDGPNKIFIGGLPNTLNEEQVKELLCTFGPLRAFHLVRDVGAPLSKGYAFFEYVDHALTPLAVSGLNGLQVLDKTVTVKVNSNSAALTSATAFPTNPPSRVIKLSNMVTKEELFDDIEYKDILEDVREECSQHGTILNLIIPRSKDGYPVACDGSVYLEYSDLAGSRTAAAALSGKKFGNNTLVVDYYDETQFANNNLTA